MLGRSRDGLACKRQVSLRCDQRRCRPGFAGRTPFSGPPLRKEGTCPTRITGKNAHAPGGAMNALPPSGPPAACVRGAGRRSQCPIAPCARPCGEKRRRAERARHAKARAAGMLYAGRDAERCRRSASDRNRARREAGLCTRCGKQQPVEGRTVCETCREVRRESEREQYALRRAAGRCGRCGAPAPDGSARRERCAGRAAKSSRKKAKNARGRRRYVRRRVRGLCIDCAAPSQGAARCPECARRSYLRSDEHRGLPILPPRYTVIEIATGADHGTWDSIAEVAMCLAYARLSREDVEVISDVSPMAALIGY